MQDMITKFKGAQGHEQFAVVFRGATTWGFSTRENALGGLRKFQDDYFAKAYFLELAALLERFWDDKRDAMTSEELADRIFDEALKAQFYRLISVILDDLAWENSISRAEDVTGRCFPSGHAPEGQKVFHVDEQRFAWLTDETLNLVDTYAAIMLRIGGTNLIPHR